MNLFNLKWISKDTILPDLREVYEDPNNPRKFSDDLQIEFFNLEMTRKKYNKLWDEAEQNILNIKKRKSK